MDLSIDQNLVNLCKEIISEHKTVQEWSNIESDDYFDSENYIGGFDATEQAFCFSYYDADREEYWFQITLEEVKKIASGDIQHISIRPAGI